MSINMKDLIGEEIFIVRSDPGGSTFEIEVHESLDDLNSTLEGICPDVVDEVKVYHGIISEARCLPQDLNNGEAYVFVVNPNNPSEVRHWGEEERKLDDLAEGIEMLISDVDSPYQHLDIEHVFVLYGYEMDLGFTIKRDSIDEENFERSEKVAEEVARLELLIETKAVNIAEKESEESEE